MRGDRVLRAAAIGAGIGVAFWVWSAVVSSQCTSTAFMGCFLAGIGQAMAAAAAFAVAGVLGLVGLVLRLGARPAKGPDPRATSPTPARTVAELDAELDRVNAELARLEGRAPR